MAEKFATSTSVTVALMALGALILGVHAPSFTPNTPEHALARWVTSHGGFVGSVAAETRGGLRGLYMTRPGSAGLRWFSFGQLKASIVSTSVRSGRRERWG